MARSRTYCLSLLLPLALAACGGADSVSNTDQAAGNAADPALASALQDQIMVDPQLGRQANSDAVRPPAQPYSGGVPDDAVAANGDKVNMEGLMKAPAPVPSDKNCSQCAAARDSVTLGGLAARQKDKRTSQCAGSLTYSAGWANRLPADLPLFPQARVTEAAGSGAVATRSAASSPEMVSQASPPASCPAAITITGASTMKAPAPSPKLRHIISAGGSRYSNCISVCDISQGSRHNSSSSLRRSALGREPGRNARDRPAARAALFGETSAT